jgi:S-DNA-T family DNA segregation ATPase FtsK/SpoIIIE
MSTARRCIGVYQPRSRKAQLAEATATLRSFFARLLGETLRRLAGAALLALAGALLLALISHNPGDPSWDNATAREALNWLGQPGSYTADLLLRNFGLAAYAFVPALVSWGWRLALARHVPQVKWRIAALVLGLLFLSAGFGALPASASLPAGTGGLIGTLVAFFTQRISESFNIGFFVLIIPVIFAVIGLMLVAMAAGIRWNSVNRFAARMAAAGETASGAALWLGRIFSFRGKPRARDDADQDEDFEEEDWVDDEPASPKEKRVPLGAPEKRVRRSEDRPKPKPKGDRQPALHLADGEYQLPPLGLLAEPPPDAHHQRISDDALEENARLLETVLSDFGVRGRIQAVRPGPVVTLYELEPAAGVKSSRVVALSDDIARSMSAVAARVAVIPGRNVIGIELPNDQRDTVYLRELFSSPEYEKSRAPLTLALGRTIGGEPVMADLAKMPHLLIAGTTGSGKSVALNTMILSLLYRMPPDQCRLIMIDPKMLELSVYDDIPHLLAPVVIDPKKAVVALKWAVREMEQRYGKMAKVGVRGVEAFNERVRKAREKGEVLKRTVQTGFDRETGRPVYEDEVLELEPMPYIVVVVDEVADLMMISGKEIEGAVQRLAQMARAAGIHLIAATQRPSVDVITGTIKANFPTRISFQVTSKIDSRTILGEQGAEQLLGQGDMLYMMAGGRIRRVHGPFVSDHEVEDVARYLKSQGRPEYLDAVTEEPDEEGDDPYGLYGGGGSGDELFDKAVAIVARDRKVSTSYIQRRLQIGYNRAARLIERMEEESMISKPNHQGKREILLPEGDG